MPTSNRNPINIPAAIDKISRPAFWLTVLTSYFTLSYLRVFYPKITGTQFWNMIESDILFYGSLFCLLSHKLSEYHKSGINVTMVKWLTSRRLCCWILVFAFESMNLASYGSTGFCAILIIISIYFDFLKPKIIHYLIKNQYINIDKESVWCYSNQLTSELYRLRQIVGDNTIDISRQYLIEIIYNPLIKDIEKKLQNHSIMANSLYSPKVMKVLVKELEDEILNSVVFWLTIIDSANGDVNDISLSDISQHANIHTAQLLLPRLSNRGQLLLQEISNLDANNVASVLLKACETGYTDMVEWLLPRLSSEQIAQTSTQNRETALIKACQGGHKNIVEWLLPRLSSEQIAQTSIQSWGTALIEACEGGHKNIVELLVPRLSNEHVGHTDSSGWTALMFACSEHGSKDMVELILPRLSLMQMTQRSDYNRTALFEACGWGHSNIVNLLLRKLWQTFMQEAQTQNGSSDNSAQRSFFEHINLVDNDGLTALGLFLLEESNQSKMGIAKQMLEYGANINLLDADDMRRLATWIHKSENIQERPIQLTIMEQTQWVEIYNQYPNLTEPKQRELDRYVDWAVRLGKKSTVEAMISKTGHHSPIEATLERLYIALHTSNIPMAEILLNAVKDEERSEILDILYHMICFENGSLDAINFLLDLGAKSQHFTDSNAKLLKSHSLFCKKNIKKSELSQQDRDTLTSLNKDLSNADLNQDRDPIDFEHHTLNRLEWMYSLFRQRRTPLHELTANNRTDVVRALSR